MSLQQTLCDSVSLIGVGLHSGKSARVTIHPAGPNHGISFVRVDMPGSPPIPANYKYVVNTQLAITLGRGKVRVSTVEHLLAALQGLGIDNALVEVDGAEIPILDGSAVTYREAILSAGIETQHQVRPFLQIRRRVEVRHGDSYAVVEPSDDFKIRGEIEWAHPSIGRQEYTFSENETDFSEIASARTFGFLRDVAKMQSMGLALGASLDNAVGLDENGVLNPEGLRHPDEFVRHKVLDAMGDFKLAGMAIRGDFLLHKAGHELHAKLVQAIFEDRANYEIIEGLSLESARPTRLTQLASGFVTG